MQTILMGVWPIVQIQRGSNTLRAPPAKFAANGGIIDITDSLDIIHLNLRLDPRILEFREESAGSKV